MRANQKQATAGESRELLTFTLGREDYGIDIFKVQEIPLLLAGKQADAEHVAGGAQKDRLHRIMELCDELAIHVVKPSSMHPHQT